MAQCLTRDLGAVSSSLTGITVLCPLARHIYPCFVLVQPRKTGPCLYCKIVDGTLRIKSNKQRETSGSSSDSLQLSPFSKWELLFRAVPYGMENNLYHIR